MAQQGDACVDDAVEVRVASEHEPTRLPVEAREVQASSGASARSASMLDSAGGSNSELLLLRLVALGPYACVGMGAASLLLNLGPPLTAHELAWCTLVLYAIITVASMASACAVACTVAYYLLWQQCLAPQIALFCTLVAREDCARRLLRMRQGRPFIALESVPLHEPGTLATDDVLPTASGGGPWAWRVAPQTSAPSPSSATSAGTEQQQQSQSWVLCDWDAETPTRRIAGGEDLGWSGTSRARC